MYNAYELLPFDEENWKNAELFQQRLIFGQSDMKFAGCGGSGNFKNNSHTT